MNTQTSKKVVKAPVALGNEIDDEFDFELSPDETDLSFGECEELLKECFPDQYGQKKDEKKKRVS